MPNTGRPSRDCHLCRRRRVKCDLTKPSCLRCLRYGEDCPGYRPVEDLMFQNEDISSLKRSQGKPERRRREKTGVSGTAGTVVLSLLQSTGSDPPRGRTSTQLARPSGSSQTPGFPPPSELQWEPPLLPTLPEILSAHAVPLLLEQYSARSVSSSSTSPHFGHHDFLPGLLLERSNKCLELAVEAFMDAYVKNHSNDNFTLAHRPSHIYGAALQAVNASLRDPRRSLQDATLAAVWLLGNYEIITASPMTMRPRDGPWGRGPAAWYIHAQGLTSILRLRGVEQLSTRAGRSLFWVALSTIQSSYILTNQPLTEDVPIWLDAIASSLQPADMAPFLVGRYVFSATAISSQINRMLQAMKKPHDMGTEVVMDLTSRIRSLEVTYTLESLPAGSQKVELHMWTIHRMALIKLHYHLILLINLVDDVDAAVLSGEQLESLRGERAASLRKIRRVGDEVLNAASDVFHAMPYGTSLRGGGEGSRRGQVMTCWADALRLLAAVSLVRGLPSMTNEQRQRAEISLDVIGLRFLIKQAMVRKFNIPPMPAHTRWRQDKVQDIT